MQNDELLNCVLPEYKHLSSAPSYKELLNKQRGNDQMTPDSEIAKQAIIEEWGVWYKTIKENRTSKSIEREIWIMQNPALITLQHIVRSDKPIIRINPKLMLTAFQTAKIEKDKFRNQYQEAARTSIPEELTWERAFEAA